MGINILSANANMDFRFNSTKMNLVSDAKEVKAGLYGKDKHTF